MHGSLRMLPPAPSLRILHELAMHTPQEGTVSGSAYEDRFAAVPHMRDGSWHPGIRVQSAHGSWLVAAPAASEDLLHAVDDHLAQLRERDAAARGLNALARNASAVPKSMTLATTSDLTAVLRVAMGSGELDADDPRGLAALRRWIVTTGDLEPLFGFLEPTIQERLARERPQALERRTRASVEEMRSVREQAGADVEARWRSWEVALPAIGSLRETVWAPFLRALRNSIMVRIRHEDDPDSLFREEVVENVARTFRTLLEQAQELLPATCRQLGFACSFSPRNARLDRGCDLFAYTAFLMRSPPCGSIEAIVGPLCRAPERACALTEVRRRLDRELRLSPLVHGRRLAVDADWSDDEKRFVRHVLTWLVPLPGEPLPLVLEYFVETAFALHERPVAP